MTRSEIIETMARANWMLAHDEPCKDWQISETTAELVAYEAAGLAVVPADRDEMLPDIEFLIRQLHIMEHHQDNKRIKLVAKKYGVEPF